MPLGFSHHSQNEEKDRDERGRDPYVATGRGGAGNIIRSPSRSRDRSVAAQEIPKAAISAAHASHLSHSGRGGAGNLRSPSRDPADRKRAEEAQAREEKLQEEYRQQEKRTPHSTGRGGAGNIAADDVERGRGRASQDDERSRSRGVGGLLRSLSRSRSREPRKADSPNRSGSRPRASESSKLAQVIETPRSSDENSSSDEASHNGAANGQNGHPKEGFITKLASHLPGHHPQ
ncbi:hypothetical protein IE53DRAFT_391288 [Violaceomyces palustris]|uniref:Uncharacterized protein n=1 Tax=Violaceomyces palustris TaxID=1673888 RepID=A0ACD0NL92_9BASI|nr:hypothetical protein IE53DRAFT_391288 [Violaceomyces palustris]